MPIVDDHTLLHFSIAALSGLLGVTVYLFKKKIEVFDKHLEACTLKNQEIAKDQTRLNNVEKDVDKFDSTLTWLGDGLVAIASKLNVKLTERP